ncbi:C-type lectin domain family 4 member A-like [Oratosquilla oratoria]|uniref:C-type lectin domain family 4 member A-like n=1 Tax=Oratosquilla oratoria TaxID=337810 RepID=UPI003F76B8EB
MGLVQALFLLFLAYSKYCHGDELAKKVDPTSLFQDLAAQQKILQDKVLSGDVSRRSTEATINRLVNENAQLKASVNLLEEEASQRIHKEMDDLKGRVAALEARVSECARDDKTKITCTPPFSEVQGHCLHVNSAVKGSWEEMRVHCKTMGADLVVIKSADFLWYLIKYLKESGLDTNDYWVGAYRQTGWKTFYWIDGTPVKTGTPFWGYLNFDTQEPYDHSQQLHICMYRKGLYFLWSADVNHFQSPICEIN